MTNISMIGLDLAKTVFQGHGVDATGRPMVAAAGPLGVAPNRYRCNRRHRLKGLALARRGTLEE